VGDYDAKNPTADGKRRTKPLPKFCVKVKGWPQAFKATADLNIGKLNFFGKPWD
jgi:hypothetical protein